MEINYKDMTNETKKTEMRRQKIVFAIFLLINVRTVCFLRK